LAYSAIANLGFILLGFSTTSFIGFLAVNYYFFIYIMASIQIFFILIVIRRQITYLKVKNIVEFVALSHSNFVLSFIFVMSLLSFAGIPPMAGFFGKVLVFFSLISQGYYLLALLAVLFSVLTSVYYIRLVRFLWFTDQDEYPVYFLVPLTTRQAYFIAIISVFNLSLFFFQGPLLLFFHEFTLLFLDCLVL